MNKHLVDFFNQMQEFFPSTRGEFNENIKEYGELLETVVIEDVFMPELLDLLNKNDDSELLEKVFGYFEQIADKRDPHLINIFSITVLENLASNKTVLNAARRYMGTKTVLLQNKVENELTKQGGIKYYGKRSNYGNKL